MTVMCSPPRRRWEALDVLTVDEDVGGVDEFLDAGAGEVGAMGGDDAVEALVGVVGGGEVCQVVSHA